eukprot:m51a1_g10045 putative cellulase (475) ;mRNA; f:31337-32761
MTGSTRALLLASLALVSCAVPLQLTGVSLAGAEFGESIPGTYEKDYIYPTQAEVDYFVGKGMNLLRIPFRWERLQRTLGGDFDSDEQGRLTRIVNYATGKGAHVLLDPHNYARWNGKIIGSSDLPYAQYVEFWKRLTAIFKSNDMVVFGLMNEPKEMDTDQWFAGAKAAYTAIRAVTKTHLILVPGNGYTGAHSWLGTWYGKSNANAWDSAGFPKDSRLMIEVHQYLDSDHSGTHDVCDPASQQTKNIEGFTAWAKERGLKAVLGEFGAGNNANCKDGIAAMLSYMEAHSDVWYGWSWWAAGPWWQPDYFLSLEGTTGNDKPQMAWLTAHIHSGAVDPISSAAHASSSSAHHASSSAQPVVSSEHASSVPAQASSSARPASSVPGPVVSSEAPVPASSSKRSESSAQHASSSKKSGSSAAHVSSSAKHQSSSKKTASSSKEHAASSTPAHHSHYSSSAAVAFPAIALMTLVLAF